MHHQTLSDHVKNTFASADSGVDTILRQLAQSATTINDKLARNGLIAETGTSGEENVYGEHVEKLDLYANEELRKKLLELPEVYAVGSEELAEPQYASHKEGKYIITFDPMDGSSNIDTNLSIGTIFGIFPRSETLLQKGSAQIASGYMLYGPSLMLFYATHNQVNGFTYDPDADEFVLTFPNVRIPEGKTYALNEANSPAFGDADRAYMESIKKEGGYSLRYVGSMVADVHRTLLKGGLYIYPADKKHESGKLRLLYEVAPLSFLIRAASGDATSNAHDPLEIVPEKHDQRVPIALGSNTEIAKYRAFHTGNQ